MSDNDSWYRSSGWSEQDQTVFFDKIQRARGNSSRSQYAKIKALSLLETKDPKKIDAAIDLLNKSLVDWPSDYEFETDIICSTLGDAYSLKRDFQTAVKYYEQALTWGNSRGSAYWEYPAMVVTEGLTDLYDRALEIVTRNTEDDDLIMPYYTFIYHAVRARVFAHQKQIDLAKQEAHLALQAADQKTSGLQYHATVGLVDAKVWQPLISALQNI